jgi:hypothetical protein
VPVFIGSIANAAGWGVFSPTSLVVKTGSIIGGQEIISMEFLSANALGTVSFVSAILGGGEGLFTQRDVVAKIGDVVDGQTITAFFRTPVINNSDDIAFLAMLSGGEGIVLATIPRTLHVTPKSGTFFNQKVGTLSSARFVTVSNTSATPVAISGIQVTGPLLQFNNCPASLAAGAQCLFATVFAPSVAGAQAGQLVFSTQADRDPYVITLSGLATP